MLRIWWRRTTRGRGRERGRDEFGEGVKGERRRKKGWRFADGIE